MCGISGVISFNENAVSHVVDFKKMLEKLSHRGPQGPGYLIDKQYALGTQRLAIRGISDGDQPIFDDESGVVAVCNGEIDNHHALRQCLSASGYFVTQKTDVAILPKLYLAFGERFVEKLEGVFAIAIWDPRTSKLILARDRAGEKPLFYKTNEDGLFFSTELSSLSSAFENKIEFDIASLHEYLFRGYFSKSKTPYQDVKKVEPGEIIVFSKNNVEKKRYWHWKIKQSHKKIPNKVEFDSIFKKAVYSQSDIDVNYGYFLSGGLDSSLIAAVGTFLRPEKNANCYTLSFSENSYDESYYAKRVASRLKLPITEVRVTAEDFPSTLTTLVNLTGEPLADPAWIPTALLAKEASKEVKLVFSGEGGDELFGGYPTYPGAKLAIFYDKLPSYIRSKMSLMVNHFPVSDRKMTIGFLLKKFIMGEKLNPLIRHLFWTASISPETLDMLGIKMENVIAEHHDNILDAIQHYDFENGLSGGLLTKADRGGMSASLEIRCPFLDKSVIEFCEKLPEISRVKKFKTKIFLKEYAELYLAKDIIYRKKRGLSVPMSSWLRGPLNQWTKSKLLSGRIETIGIRSEGIASILRAHDLKEKDYSRALWTLLVLDEWLLSQQKLKSA